MALTQRYPRNVRYRRSTSAPRYGPARCPRCRSPFGVGGGATMAMIGILVPVLDSCADLSLMTASLLSLLRIARQPDQLPHSAVGFGTSPEYGQEFEQHACRGVGDGMPAVAWQIDQVAT